MVISVCTDSFLYIISVTLTESNIAVLRFINGDKSISISLDVIDG